MKGVKVRRTLIAAAVVLVVLVGGIGAAAVITAPATATAQEGEFDERVGTREAGGFIDEALADLVAAGVIEERHAAAVKDALLDRLRDRRAEFEHRRDRLRERFRETARKALETAAEVIGIETEELIPALRDGRSIADVAAENGVDAREVVEALAARAYERIDAAVADGKLDADRAEELKDRVLERIEVLVDRSGLEGPFRHRRSGPGGDEGFHRPFTDTSEGAGAADA